MNKPMENDDVIQWKPLVMHIVNRKFYWAFSGNAREGRIRPVDRDELIEVGLLALWRAWGEYDSSKGTLFKTFAYNAILFGIRRYLESKKSTIGRNVALFCEISEKELGHIRTLEDHRHENIRREYEAHRLISQYRKAIKDIATPLEYQIMLLRDEGYSYYAISKIIKPRRTYETARKHHLSLLRKIRSFFGNEIEENAETL